MSSSSRTRKVYSNLDLVNKCDGFPSFVTHPSLHAETLSTVALFTYHTYTLGYILPTVQDALRFDQNLLSFWTISGNMFSLKGSTAEERSNNMRQTCEYWRDNKTFSALGGWRDELYNVYAPKGKVCFSMERAATALFGVVTYGVHLTAYVNNPLRIWTPRRSVMKQTWPGFMDNTVAGGITAGLTPWEVLLKEGKEEASLSEEVMKAAKCTGTISYFLIRGKEAGGEEGLLQPEIEYCYDLELGEDVIPKPCDDEVQEFFLEPVENIQKLLREGVFKPNCALVLLDFFIRHNIITPENEQDYIEIVARLHRRLEFPTA